MTYARARARRALLAMLAATTTAALASAPAHAALDTANASVVNLDSTSHWWNQPNPTTHYDATLRDDFQYTVYWDQIDGSGNVYAVLTRRKLSDNSRETIKFDGTAGTTAQRLKNPNDGHNYVTLGLSPNDGRIHISWSPHNEPHRYGISSSGCLSQARLSSCTFTWNDDGSGGIDPSRYMDPSQDDRPTATRAGTLVDAERTLTYPFYFNDSRGRLYFSYRFGQSARGNAYINQYQDNGRWRSRGLVIQGRYWEIDFPRDDRSDTCNSIGETSTARTACHRGTYVGGTSFDKRDRLHMFWVHKEWARDITGQYSIRGIYYAYSDDFGDTWYTAAGRRIADVTTGTDPIRASNDPATDDAASALVLSTPFGTGTVQPYMEVDSNDLPHLVFFSSDTAFTQTDDAAMNMRNAHLWLTSDGTWHDEWAEPSGHGRYFPWGGPAFDRADNLYYPYMDNPLDWAPYNREIYGQTDLQANRVSWQDGRYLDVQQMSDTHTCLDTTEYPGTAIDMTNVKQIRFSLNNNTDATQFYLHYATDAAPVMAVSRRVVVRVSANDRTAFNPYTADMSTATDRDWTGTLRALEICAIDTRADAGDQFKLDWIRVTDTTGRAVKSWEFDTGPQLKYITANAEDNWSTYTTADLLPARFRDTAGVDVSDRWTDNGFLPDRARFKRDAVLNLPINEQGRPLVDSLGMVEVGLTATPLKKDWAFPYDLLGWSVVHDVGSLRWTSDGGVGSLSGSLTGGDPAVKSLDMLGVPVDSSDRVWIRMKNSTTARIGRVWFVTDASPTYNSARSRDFTINASDPNYTWYEFNPTSLSGWNGGVLKQLRIDPSNDSRVTTGSFLIDRVVVGPSHP